MGQELPTPFSMSGYGGMPSGMYSGMGDALANIISGFGNMNMPNPSDSSMPYLNNAMQMMGQYYSPYINQGQQGFSALNNYMNLGNNAANALSGIYGNLTSNPTGIMNQIGSTFHQSPGYNWQVQQSLNSANRAAAAGGMAGSPAEQQQIAGVTNQLANQDYYNYLNHGLSMFGQGLSGYQGLAGMGLSAGQNVYGIGANASNNFAQNLGALAMSQANNAYAGQINQNQSQGGAWGEIASGVGDIAALAGFL